MSVKKIKSKRYPSGFGYLLDLQYKNLPRVRQTFPTEKLAKDAEAVARADFLRRKFALPTDSKITLADLVEQHVERTVSKRPKAAWITSVLQNFRDYAGADRTVESLKKADLADYAEWREGTGLKPQSVNREVVEIKSCLSSASQYFRALNDWQPPKAVWLDETHDGRDRTWSEGEYLKFLEYCFQPKRPREKDWQLRQRMALGELLIVISQTGLRPGEACRLRKTDLDLNDNEIAITSRKGIGSRGKARSRRVPMTADVMAILSRRAETGETPYLFPNRSGDGPMANYIMSFRRICERIGINYGQRNAGGLVLNDMRATAENRMLDAGYSAKAVCDILGHSPETMARHYARTSKKQKHEAVTATRFGVSFSSALPALTSPTSLTIEGEEEEE